MSLTTYTREAARRRFPPTKDAPMPMIAKLDELGTGAWIALSIIGFVFWWPVGLALLAFTIGSGRMSWWNHRQRSALAGSDGTHAGQDGPHARPHGEFRRRMVGRPALERQPCFLMNTRRRDAAPARRGAARVQGVPPAPAPGLKDKAEFDMFMAERRNRDGHAGDVPEPEGSAPRDLCILRPARLSCRTFAFLTRV